MRWRCLCAYNGSSYSGWQRQLSGQTVQYFVERRLEEIFHRKVSVVGAGRTDAGVHACGQVFHFDAHWPHSDEALQRALQTGCPKTIQVLSVEAVSSDFHSQKNVYKKRYSYHIYRGRASPFFSDFCYSIGCRNLDLDAMISGAALFLGCHDFSFFAARGSTVGNPVKRIDTSRLDVDGKWLHYTTEGSGYLYKMVRRMVGSLLQIGLGKITLDALARFLATPEIHPLRIDTAPAQGLFLERITYDCWAPEPQQLVAEIFPHFPFH